MAHPDVRAKLAALDADVLALDAAGFDALIERERQRWGELIRRRKIQIQ